MRSLTRLVPSIALLFFAHAASAADGPSLGFSAPLREGTAAAFELRANAPPPLRLAEKAGTRPLAELRAASATVQAEIGQISLWNRSGRLPAQNGFARALAAPQVVTFEALGTKAAGEHAGGRFQKAADGGVIWGASVKVEGAYRLRLHLTDIDLPAAARLWVYGGAETVGPFGLELQGPGGDLWTPSIGGDTLRLEVELPAGAEAPRFTIDKVIETFELASDGSPLVGPGAAKGASCLVDAQCVSTGTFDVIDLAQRAIARIQFTDGFLSFLCSGGLLNDLSQSGIPYFLTANHCLDEQPAAATLEAVWDYFTPTCGGVPPNPDTLPLRSNGSTLLASSALSDFTLVRLLNLPGNRVFLGWNANAVANGTVLHRISHPFGEHQHYSRNHVDSTAEVCNGAPHPNFLYETFTTGDQGGTFGGSSGSPAILAGGQVVGQLTGACGPNPQDGCDYDNAEVDGAFSESFDFVGPFLADTAFLLGNRFSVEMEWRANAGDEFQPARLLSFTNNAAQFYFTNPNNAELLIKVLNACALNNRYWTFFAATTNVQFRITVTDTLRGVTKTYTNPLGNPAAPVQDTTAFATCP